MNVLFSNFTYLQNLEQKSYFLALFQNICDFKRFVSNPLFIEHLYIIWFCICYNLFSKYQYFKSVGIKVEFSNFELLYFWKLKICLLSNYICNLQTYYPLVGNFEFLYFTFCSFQSFSLRNTEVILESIIESIILVSCFSFF